MSDNIVLDGADARMHSDIRTAGGSGMLAARQSALLELRRLTLAFLLWDDPAYTNAPSNQRIIRDLVTKCNPEDVANLAIEIRTKQGLRHTPLFLIRELFRRPEARVTAGQALPKVIQRADEITAFLELYWKEGKVPLAAQAKKGLNVALNRLTAYSAAKYKDEDKSFALRDVMFLTHPKPKDLKSASKWTKAERKQQPLRPEFASEKETLFYQMASKTLPVPRTRETLLSESKNDKERKEAYVALLEDDELYSTALLKNLAAMDRLGVPRDLVKAALMKAKTERILPLQFFSAFSKAPMYREEINSLMRKALAQFSKLRGTTVMVVDMSGSMHNPVSSNSEFKRVDAAKALAVMAREVCDHPIIYATAGNDHTRIHKTVRISNTPRGFDLADAIQREESGLGGGGIYTRQALEWIKADLKAQSGDVDRILVFSDSQDCDQVNKVPAPFGRYNYIIDVSANQFGINYKGVWTQEISGWSQHFIEYVAQCEAGYQSSLL